MRPRSRGLFVPGVVLTLLSSLGVIVLLLTALQVIGAPVPSFIVSEAADRDPSTLVVSPHPTGRPSPTPSYRPSPHASPSRRATPSHADDGGHTGRPPGRGSHATSSQRPVGPTRRPSPTRASTPTVAPTPKAPACAAGSATVTAVADAYVDETAPQTNFGSQQRLYVASRDKARNRRTVVRFALPALPRGCKVTGAVLALSAADSTGRRVLAQRAASGWTERGVTWTAKPSATGTAASATVVAGRVEWQVAGQVVAMYGSGNFGFVLRDAVENASQANQANFSSREGRSAPTLTVRWS